MKQAMRRRALCGALVVALVGVPGMAGADEDPGLHNEAGIGALAALSTLIYGPAKLVYATAGLLFGGVAWGLSGGDGDVLTAVVTPSVRGDYVITPEHIRMERTIEFLGRDPRYRNVQQATIAPPADAAAVSSAPLERRADARVYEEDY